MEEHIFPNLKEANDFIENYEKRTSTHYVIQFSRHTDFKLSRVWFQDDRGDSTIHFDGVPFSIGYSQLRVCHQGVPRKKSVKTVKDSDHDNSYQSDQKCIQDTKKKGCESRIKIKCITRFPQYKIESNTKLLRRKAVQDLKANYGESTIKEESVHVTVYGSHSGHVLGKMTTCNIPVAKRVSTAISSIVKNGAKTVRDIRQNLPKVTDVPSSHRGYPTDQDIRNHMNYAKRKERRLHMQNVEKKRKREELTEVQSLVEQSGVPEMGGPGSSLLIEVASGDTTNRYVIEAPDTLDDCGSVNVAHDIASVLFAAEQTMQEMEEHIFPNWKEANDFIENYEKRTSTHYVTQFSRNKDFKLSRVRFQHDRGDSTIRFDGVPFSIGYSQLRVCHQGVPRKKSVQTVKDSDHDNSYQGDQKRIQDKKTEGCKSKIKIKCITRFPQYKIESNTKRLRRKAVKDLKANYGESTIKEESVHVTVYGSHSGHELGKMATRNFPVAKSVSTAISSMVKNGAKTVRDIRQNLSKVADVPSSHRGYPTDRDIRNHMDYAKRKERRLQNVEKKRKREELTEVQSLVEQSGVPEMGGPGSSLLIEVASGDTTSRYVIEEPDTLDDSGSVNVAHDIANVLLAAEQTMQEMEEHIFPNWKEANDFIENYEKRTSTHYVTQFSRHTDLKLSRVWFQHDRGDSTIRFDGVPFSIGYSQLRVCHQGVPRKKSVQTVKDSDHDNSYQSDQKCIQDTNKKGCESRIKIKSITRFPQYKIESNTKRLRRKAVKDLKANYGESTIKEESVHVTVYGSHSGHVLGKMATCNFPVAKSVSTAISSMVKNGAKTVRDIRQNLPKVADVPSSHRGYYPTDRDIRNHMDYAKRKERRLHLQNVEKKRKREELTEVQSLVEQSGVPEMGGPGSSLLIEVASGDTTSRYVIEAPDTLDDCGSVNMAHDIASFLFAAEQTIQEDAEVTQSDGTTQINLVLERDNTTLVSSDNTYVGQGHNETLEETGALEEYSGEIITEESSSMEIQVQNAYGEIQVVTVPTAGNSRMTLDGDLLPFAAMETVTTDTSEIVN